MPFHKLDKKGIMIYIIKSLGQVNSAKIGGTAIWKGLRWKRLYQKPGEKARRQRYETVLWFG